MISFILKYYDENINIYPPLILDFILFVFTLINGDRSILLLYLLIISIAVGLEWLYQQMVSCNATTLTEENLEKYSIDLPFLIEPNLRVAI
jgi:hypothetical protein